MIAKQTQTQMPSNTKHGVFLQKLLTQQNNTKKKWKRMCRANTLKSHDYCRHTDKGTSASQVKWTVCSMVSHSSQGTPSAVCSKTMNSQHQTEQAITLVRFLIKTQAIKTSNVWLATLFSLWHQEKAARSLLGPLQPFPWEDNKLCQVPCFGHHSFIAHCSFLMP